MRKRPRPAEMPRTRSEAANTESSWRIAGVSFRKRATGQPPSSDEVNVIALPTKMVAVGGVITGVTRHTAGALAVVASWQPRRMNAKRRKKRRIKRYLGAA